MLATLLAPLFLVPPAAGECEGVLVVVQDAQQRVESSCRPGGGTAADVLTAAGYRLERVQRFPGAVCRVDGVPAEAPCVAMPPADAYWGLFVAESGEWEYADLGVDALDLRPGDAVAMAWQDTPRPVPPGVAPTADALAADSSASGDAAGSADAARPGQGDRGGLPAWVPAAAGVLLLGTVAALALRRRR